VDESDCDTENGYLLHKHNCPYADVSTEHSELCLMDQALINELLGRPCQRISSMAEDGGCCTYRVGPVEGNQRDSTTQNVEWADWTAPAPAG
jgi:predicted ArsR family transcriptional regulator